MQPTIDTTELPKVRFEQNILFVKIFFDDSPRSTYGKQPALVRALKKFMESLVVPHKLLLMETYKYAPLIHFGEGIKAYKNCTRALVGKFWFVGRPSLKDEFMANFLQNIRHEAGYNKLLLGCKITIHLAQEIGKYAF